MIKLITPRNFKIILTCLIAWLNITCLLNLYGAAAPKSPPITTSNLKFVNNSCQLGDAVPGGFPIFNIDSDGDGTNDNYVIQTCITKDQYTTNSTNGEYTGSKYNFLIPEFKFPDAIIKTANEEALANFKQAASEVNNNIKQEGIVRFVFDQNDRFCMPEVLSLKSEDKEFTFDLRQKILKDTRLVKSSLVDDNLSNYTTFIDEAANYIGGCYPPLTENNPTNYYLIDFSLTKDIIKQFGLFSEDDYTAYTNTTEAEKIKNNTELAVNSPVMSLLPPDQKINFKYMFSIYMDTAFPLDSEEPTVELLPSQQYISNLLTVKNLSGYNLSLSKIFCTIIGTIDNFTLTIKDYVCSTEFPSNTSNINTDYIYPYGFDNQDAMLLGPFPNAEADDSADKRRQRMETYIRLFNIDGSATSSVNLEQALADAGSGCTCFDYNILLKSDPNLIYECDYSTGNDSTVEKYNDGIERYTASLQDAKGLYITSLNLSYRNNLGGTCETGSTEGEGSEITLNENIYNACKNMLNIYSQMKNQTVCPKMVSSQ